MPMGLTSVARSKHAHTSQVSLSRVITPKAYVAPAEFRHEGGWDHYSWRVEGERQRLYPEAERRKGKKERKLKKGKKERGEIERREEREWKWEQ